MNVEIEISERQKFCASISDLYEREVNIYEKWASVSKPDSAETRWES